jgi:hypothetical protein
MLHKVSLLGAALVGGSLLVSTGAFAQTVDATHYTIVCDTFSKASAGFKPSLVIGGALTPESVKLKGTLSGCTATPDGSNPPITVVSGSVSGLLTGGTNDCLSLLGPSMAAGTITIKWKVASPVKLTSATTTITVTSGDISGGTSTPFADAASYGSFSISSTTQTGPFGGPSGTGAASFTKALTVEGVTNLGSQCAPGGKGLKAVNFGPTEVNLG